MSVTRRELLRMGAMAAPGLSLARLAEAQAEEPRSPAIFPFTRPLNIPPVLATVSGPPGQDSYHVTMQQAMADIITGLPTPVWSYNGLYPGPTIRARADRQVNVQQTNNLPESTSVHLHGGHASPSSDGHPTDLIAPGGQKAYTYPNHQLPATLWYHDHAVDVTGPHVYMGLAGFYIMSDTLEDNLNLPGPGPSTAFDFDIPLIVQDRSFNADGSFAYPLPVTENALLRGLLGDRVLVNGVIQPFFSVTRRKWRFRLLNGSNSRSYDFSLSNGQPFIQIGSDGGLLTSPVNRTVIRLGPGERVDLVIDFSSLPTGTQVFLRNTNREIPVWLDHAPRRILRFDVGNPVIDTSVVPAVLRPVTPLGPEVLTRDFNLSRGMVGGSPVWFIDGQPFDPATINANPGIGSIEVWRFRNLSNFAHPMHVHLVQFQIVDINGQPPGPGDAGWKDTVNVPRSGGVVRVKAQFLDFTGTYVFHGHVLERQDHAMMGQFQVMP